MVWNVCKVKRVMLKFLLALACSPVFSLCLCLVLPLFVVFSFCHVSFEYHIASVGTAVVLEWASDSVNIVHCVYVCVCVCCAIRVCFLLWTLFLWLLLLFCSDVLVRACKVNDMSSETISLTFMRHKLLLTISRQFHTIVALSLLFRFLGFCSLLGPLG